MKAELLAKKAREDGLVGKLLFAVWTKPVDVSLITPNIISQHMDFLKNLEEEGVLFAAGPLFDERGEDHVGEGLIVVKAAGLAEARQLASADPMHASGAREFTLRPWLLNEGTFTP